MNGDPTQARRALGRDSYQRGQSFEERVAELYRLLRYQVELGRLFGGRQVDVFLQGRFGDMTLRRAIECKAGQVQASDIDAFFVKLRLVRADFPDAHGTIVSGVGFTDAVATHAAREGIQLTHIRDLEATLVDSHGYVTNLIRRLESDTTYPLDFYVDQLLSYEHAGKGIPSDEVVETWLTDGGWNHITVLGDVGTGKSFLSRIVAHRLGKAYLARPNEAPFPLLIDLRNADREFSLEGLVITHAARVGLGQLTFDVFEYLLAQGRVVVLLDGFDEMAARVTNQVTTRNFNQLVRTVRGRAKVLLTCRTHYFRSQSEEEQVIRGSQGEYTSEAARDLYWDLIARRGFRVVYVTPFDLSQIERYVTKARPTDAKAAMERIRTTYNLMELSQRPMLLEMIVKSIDAVREGNVTAAGLYEVFTNVWIQRDQWRDILSPELKSELLMGLAKVLWRDDVRTVHYSALIGHVKGHLGDEAKDLQRVVEVDHEIRTASFLVRDEQGNYSFAHKSYLEFFVARHCARLLLEGRVECLAVRPFSPELLAFLMDMVDPAKIDETLSAVVTSDYRPMISENALLCLYAFRRRVRRSEDGLQVQLPDSMRLNGARLTQMGLEGAVMRGALLDEANLAEAILIGADLSDSSFVGANLEKADLRLSICRRVVMEGAKLSWCNLERADLSAARLTNAILSDAYIGEANFDGAVLPQDATFAERTTTEWSSLVEQDRAPGAGAEERFWTAIVAIMPRLERAARRMLPARDLNADDFGDMARDVAIRLAEPKIRDRFLAGSAGEQWGFAHETLATLIDRRRAGRERAVSAEDVHLRPGPVELDAMHGGRVRNIDELFESWYAFDESATPGFQNVVFEEFRARLSPDAWRVFEMYSQGYSFREVAEELKMSIAGVHRLIGSVRDIATGVMRQR